LALLTLDSADPDALRARIAPLADVGGPWRYTATEIMASLARRKGDLNSAAQYYKSLADDIGAPQSIRARAAEMLATITIPSSPSLDQPKG
jgi:hypothetical protein